MQHSIKNLFLLFFLGVIWGLHIVLTKALGANGLQESMAYLVLYMVGAAIGLGIIAIFTIRRFKLRYRHIKFFMIGAILGYILPVGGEMLIAPHVDASIFALITSMVPIGTIAICVVLKRMKVNIRHIAALILGVFAAILLLWPDLQDTNSTAIYWLIAAFAIPIFYAADTTYVEIAWPEDLDTIQISTFESTIGAILTILLALALGVRGGDVALAAQNGGMILIGLICVALFSVILFFHLIKNMGAVMVSFGGFISLATGVLGGVIFFGEQPHIFMWIACVLIVASLLIIGSEKKV